LLCVIFLVLTVPVFVATENAAPLTIRDGKAAAGEASFRAGPVPLTGEWLLVVLPSAAARHADLVGVHVPGPWKGKVLPSGKALGADGRFAYDLTLEGVAPGTYRLYVPPIWGASAVYVDNRLRSSRGTVGRDPATSRYRLQAHDVTFDAPGGELPFRIEISTFHDRSNGMRTPPVLGRADAMHRWVSLVWARTFLVTISFLVIGLFAFNVYVHRRSDRSALFLALGSLCLMGTQAILSFENLLLLGLPDLQHEWVYAILVVCSFGALIFWVAYVDALFPEVRARSWSRLVITLVTTGMAWQLGSIALAGTMGASRTIVVFVASVAIAGLYVTVRSVHALIRGHDQALLFMVGQLAIVIAVGFQTTVNLSLVAAPDFVSYGLLVFAFTHLVVLARRWTGTIETAETLNSDLGRLLEVNSAVASEEHLATLLSRIVGVTSRILEAERSTLFLHDHERGELWSLVAEGMGSREIRFPDTLGIAGSAFHNVHPIRVDDPYHDPRFNPQVDAESGFLTRNILCAPLIARDGNKLGVIQVLNKRTRKDFSPSDEERLAAFSAQAAVAIDNANLFAAVVEARNYNESILASMSSGVITLQEEGKKTQLNDAALRILGLSEDASRITDARVFIERANPWLGDEVRTVAQNEISKSLLDREIVTVGNGVISATVSLVPLRDRERVTGVLMMVDDISASKRLEGAMRRFMTQEVMEQVLAHDQQALFGSSCHASVLFADIRGFTSLAEALTARETVAMLNELFTDLFEAVEASKGMLDKYIGDAVMAVYGVPLSSGQDAFNAVTSGIEMLRLLEGVNSGRLARGLAPLRIGIGVSTGEVVAGTIGSPKRMDYTVIGDTVNLASRLQDLTKSYDVPFIVCEATAAAVQDHLEVYELDTIQVRGRQRAERIYSVTVPQK
jgi:PAS domain S-box-containing protein